MRKEISRTETSVGTLARGLDILGLFARSDPELTQTEISDALHLPLPTVHRLTAVLAERGFLERDPRTRRFRLGLEVARFMPPLLTGLRLPELARADVTRLAVETGETANLAVLQDGQVVYLLSESGGRLLSTQTPIGLRLPAHCTALGKCLLAHLPEEAARDAAGPEPHERRTQATATTWEALRPALARIRRDGVALSWEEYEIGLASIAVPVAWLDGPATAALNVSLPTTRANRAFRAELVARLRAFAAGLAAEIADEPQLRWQGMPSDADSRTAYAALGEAGWIGLHWPGRLGGRGRALVDTVACEERFGYHWLPLSGYLLSVKTIGNALARFAAPELQERLLPEVAAGRLLFCQGFSEPEAGSDLGSLRTVALDAGDRFVVSGRKLWTSSAEVADWIYLAARTGPEPRHRGISVLVAPLATPGITVTGHATLGGGTLGEVVLDDAEVPRAQLVGALDGGWAVLMGTLDHERVTSEKVGVVLWLLDRLDELAGSPADRARLLRLRGEAEAA